MAQIVRMVLRGLRQILRHAIFKSTEKMGYLLGFFRLATVKTLFGRSSGNVNLL